MDIDTPLTLLHETVRPEWLDYNGHMNVTYYVLTFDHATDALLKKLDLGIEHINRTQCSVFVLESHITYQRELVNAAPLRFTTQLLDADAKRLHYFYTMHHAEEGYIAATNELIAIHVDLETRRSKPFPICAKKMIAKIKESHSALPKPPEVGNVMKLRA